MSKNEHTNEYYERMIQHSDCVTSRGRRVNPIEYFVKVNAVVIPENATVGEVIKAVFPDVKWFLNEDNEVFTDHKTRNSSTIRISADTWNAPYKRGVTT